MCLFYVQVLQLLKAKSTFKSGVSEQESAQQLDLLLRLVPDWIKQENRHGDSLASLTAYIRISHKQPWGMVRTSLLTRLQEAQEVHLVTSSDDEPCTLDQSTSGSTTQAVINPVTCANNILHTPAQSMAKGSAATVVTPVKASGSRPSVSKEALELLGEASPALTPLSTQPDPLSCLTAKLWK